MLVPQALAMVFQHSRPTKPIPCTEKLACHRDHDTSATRPTSDCVAVSEAGWTLPQLTCLLRQSQIRDLAFLSRQEHTAGVQKPSFQWRTAQHLCGPGNRCSLSYKYPVAFASYWTEVKHSQNIFIQQTLSRNLPLLARFRTAMEEFRHLN